MVDKFLNIWIYFIIEIQGCAPETSIWYCQFQSWELWRHDDVFMEFAIEIMRNQSQRQDR